jgi:type II secretion system protein H
MPYQHSVSRFRGFSLVELAIVLAIIGALTVVVAPSLLSYWRTASLLGGARELASAMNLARQLAISRGAMVCIDLGGTNVRLRIGGCSGPIWTGATTDAAGVIRISDPATLEVSSNARVVFTPLGAATPSGTYRVTDPRTHMSRAVVVAASGRISVE